MNWIFKTISFIRFPMILGIIVIHCNMCGNNEFFSTISPHGVASFIQDFFSNSICRSCVPLFFVISGFLFFNNIHTLSLDVYKNKLKSRVRSLLVPYLLWNLIGVCILLFEKMPFMQPFFPGLALLKLNLSVFLSAFWNFNEYNFTFFDNGSTPIDFPLWFIRNLMILIIASPIVYYIIKKWEKIIYLLAACYIFGIWPNNIDALSCTGVFFFSVGAYLGIKKPFYYIDYATKSNVPFIFFLFSCFINTIVFQYCSSGILYQIVHSLCTIIGVVALFSVARRLVDKGIEWPNYLTHTTFFIYAFHGLISNITKKSLILVFEPATNFSWIMMYILAFILISGFSIFAYYVCRCISIKLTGILSGNR